MLANFNMNRKLLLTLLPVTLIISAVILIFTLQAVKNSVSDTAMQTSKQLVTADGKDIVESLVKNYNRLIAVAETMVIRKNLNIFEGRGVISDLLKAQLESEPNILGVWTGWEPNAFDGLDARFAETEGSDETGRFLPYFYRDGDKISLTNIEFYEDPIKGAYYQQAKQKGEPIVLDPFVYPVAGKDVLMTTISIPIFENNQFVGVLGIDIKVDSFQEAVSQLNQGKTVSALFSQNGTIVAHPDPSRLGQNMANTEQDFLGERVPMAAKAINEGKAYASTFYANIINENALVIFEPIQIGELNINWSMARLTPLKVVLEDVYTITFQVALIGFAGLVVLVLVIILLARSLASPLTSIAEALEDVASGEGDLTQRLKVTGKDEVSRISLAFNTFAQQIQTLVTNLAAHSQTLASTSNQLSTSSSQSATGANEQRTQIEQLATAMEELSTTVHEVANNAQQSSKATLTVREETQQGAKLIEDIASTISGQAAEIANTASYLAELENASNEIGAVITTIQDVAEQTNLLALNAAIEAARAGEHGRGFAVVADEVRNLASRTHSSTEEISSTIERLQSRIQQAVAAMGISQELSEASVEKAEEGLTALEAITQQVEQIEEMNHLVASTTEQQSATSSQLSQNALRLGELADEASQGANETASGSQAIYQLAKELNELISRFKY